MDDVDVRPLTLVCFAAVTTLALLVLLLLLRRGLAAALRRGNVAERLAAAGQVTAIFLVAANAVKSALHGEHLAADVAWVGVSGLVGLALVVVLGELGGRLLLAARLPAELARGNVAAGLAAGAYFVATGIVTSRAIGADDVHGLGVAVAFFVLGQLTLQGFVTLFRALTTYDDAEQIAGENLPAALSYAGVAIAVAILVGRAVEGDFTGWAHSLRAYAGMLASVLALYPVRQVFVQTVLLGAPPSLRGGPIDAGIAVERSVGVAALEALTYVGTALAITHLV